MSQTEARPASTIALVGLFAASFLLMAVIVNVIAAFIKFENPAMGLIIAFAAGMTTAQFWVSREQARPAAGRMWLVAALCGLAAVVIMGTVAALGLLGSRNVLHEIRRDSEAFVIVAAVISGVVILVIRLGMAWGARQALAKAKARRTS